LREGESEDTKLLLETEFTDCYSAVNPLVSILKTSPDTEEPRSLQLLLPKDVIEDEKTSSTKYSIGNDRIGPEIQDKILDKTSFRPSLTLPKFEDPFDAYLYQSYHITTPIVTPTLLFPTQDKPGYLPGDLTSNVSNSFFRRSSHTGHRGGDVGDGEEDDEDEDRSKSRTSSLLHVPIQLPIPRSRGVSLPDNLYSHDLYRLRNFSLFGKKVVNNGDIVKSRSSSMNSTCSSIENLQITCPFPAKLSSGESRFVCRGSGQSENYTDIEHNNILQTDTMETQQTLPLYKVILVGSTGVGKSSLCSQFLSSENINTYETEDFTLVEKNVVLSVNGQESKICFIDHPHGRHEIEDLFFTYSPDAVLVVMAVDDFSSYLLAQSLIEKLSRIMKLEKNPIILVANKADMVRNRKVKSSLGKELATANNIKYIETSSGINHNIDELLVGIYTQIQLRQKTEGHVRKSSLTNKVGSFLGSLLTRSTGQAKSCSNLSVI